MIKLLFICHGNICRSPMAEYVMQELVRQRALEAEFEIASCATSREDIGSDVHPGTRSKLQRMNIPCGHRAARQLTRHDSQYYDYLIIMDEENACGVRRILGRDAQEKVHRLLDFAQISRDVADPWYTGDFDATYEDVLTGCTALLEQLCGSHEEVDAR